MVCVCLLSGTLALWEAGAWESGGKLEFSWDLLRASLSLSPVSVDSQCYPDSSQKLPGIPTSPHSQSSSSSLWMDPGAQWGRALEHQPGCRQDTEAWGFKLSFWVVWSRGSLAPSDDERQVGYIGYMYPERMPS